MVEISIDFETYSETDLTKVGVWKYAEHPSTEILCMSYSVNNGEVRHIRQDTNMTSSVEIVRSVNGELRHIRPDISMPLPIELVKLINNGCKLRAWNANFERAIWELVAVKRLNWPPVAIHQWIDDMAIAAYFSYPLSLERCGAALKRCGKSLGLPIEHLKDVKGTLLINRFSKPRKPTKNDPRIRILPTDDPIKFNEFVDYCDQDVRAQQAIVKALPRQNLPEAEQKAWELDSLINSKGLNIDVEMAQGAIKLMAKHEESLLKEFSELTNGEVTSVKQTAKFLIWLSSQGTYIPDLKKETVHNKLNNVNACKDLTPKTERALRIRQELGLASVAKYKKMLEAACIDGRVRGTIQFMGATRTGRFAGRLIQIQNFPKGTQLIEGTIDAIKAVKSEYFNYFKVDTLKTLSNGLRQAIIAPKGKRLSVADYASIENRVLAWYANDEATLQGFRDNTDQYKVMASSLFNVPYEDVTTSQRHVGKVIILGCGYQMGHKTFHETANGIYKLGITLEEAEFYVHKYRETYYKNAILWRALDKAAKDALRYRGKAFVVGGTPNGRVIYKVIGQNLYCKLPSGRNLCYPKARIVNDGWDKIYFKAEIMRKWVDSSTYGGKLCENICQATSRDLLVNALNNLHAAGYETVAHVHDEIICETQSPQTLDEQIAIMTKNPPWAETLPLKAEGYFGRRYKK